MVGEVAIGRCYFCHTDKEVILRSRGKGELEHGVYNLDPCEECKKYMEQGIIVISIRNDEPPPEKGKIPNPHRTGGWWVVKEQAFKEIFKGEELIKQATKLRFAFAEDRTCEAVGLTKLKP